MSGWGKAGVRLSARDANRIKLSAALGRQRKEADLAEARALWGQGKMVPHRITMALDICGLYGPDVDVACGAVEPDVDRWEAGKLYPTWQQVLLLSNLTGFPPRFFFIPVGPEPMRTSLEFHMPGSPPKPHILSFHPTAHTAQRTVEQGVLW